MFPVSEIRRELAPLASRDLIPVARTALDGLQCFRFPARGRAAAEYARETALGCSRRVARLN
jgi:hypothetical protein